MKVKGRTITLVCCKRCGHEFRVKDFEITSHAIKNSVWLCPICSAEWLRVRENRGLSNIHYVREGDAIDW